MTEKFLAIILTLMYWDQDPILIKAEQNEIAEGTCISRDHRDLYMFITWR